MFSVSESFRWFHRGLLHRFDNVSHTFSVLPVRWPSVRWSEKEVQQSRVQHWYRRFLCIRTLSASHAAHDRTRGIRSLLRPLSTKKECRRQVWWNCIRCIPTDGLFPAVRGNCSSMRRRFFRNGGNSQHRKYPVGSRRRLSLRRLPHPDGKLGYLPVCSEWYHIICWRLQKLLRVHFPVWSKAWCLLRRGCISLCEVSRCNTTSPMLPISRLCLLYPLTVGVLWLRLSLSARHSSKGHSADSLHCCHSLPLFRPVQSWHSYWNLIS